MAIINKYFRIISFLSLLIFSLSFGMEPYQGRVNMSEEHYTAMQGIIHFIGWSIAIGILIFVFKYMKKHAQQDERYKKYVEKSQSEGNKISPDDNN